MMIENLKKNKQLKPYFLWYLKSNLLMPKTVHMIIIQGAGKHRGMELILNYEKALTSLVSRLKKEGIDEESMGIIVNEVCQYFIEEMGPKKIMDSSPELLIQHEYAQN